VFERLRSASFILGYRREPSASSEKAEKRSNCHMANYYIHELGDDGRDGDIFHEIIDK